MRIAPRRWLWLLNTVAIICVILAARQNPVVDSTRVFARSSIQWVLMPVAWTLNRVQSTFNYFAHSRADQQSALDQLRDHDRNQLALLLHKLDVLQNRYEQTLHIHADYPKAQLRFANIQGFSSDSVDQCVLDQGWRDDARIKAGSPVMADLAVVGYVDSVGADTCTVRLLSDVNMQESAAIVRTTSDGQLPICSQGVLLQGRGGGKMYCDLPVAAGALIPQMGDLVVLNDNEWPAAVNGAVIGIVDSVLPSDQNSLHMILQVRPPVDMQQARQAAIVLPE
ncbi:MAG TPA: rod shape-determining protein MreC [Phycisphaerae bacterium]|nr:rod shape-determining protein MreC [Phycisphaerae bacterium]